MIANGDFTNGLTGWNFRADNTTLSLDSTSYGESPPSCVVTRTGTVTYWSGLWQKLRGIVPGEKYVFQLRLKAAAGVQHYANLDFYDKNETYVSGWWQLLTGTGDWQTVRAEITIPDGIYVIDAGAFIGTSIGFPPAVGTSFSVDDVFFGKETAPFFPYLPPEIAPTEAEQAFIDSQPYGLWPENQDSNIGQLRRVITDQVQVNIDKVNTLALEMWPDQSTDYMSLWEEMLGLPIAPSGKALVQRRAITSSARKKGAFTRARIRGVVEEYIGATFGEAASFGPGGLNLSGGVPLYSGVTSYADAYRVYEDFVNFAYEVYVKTGVSPDARLIEELKRITPAGITPSLVTVANVLNYGKTIRNSQPELYLRMNNLNDSSGYGRNATANGGIGAGGGSGLLSPSINDGPGASTFFDGVNDFLFVGSDLLPPSGDILTIEFIAYLQSMAAPRVIASHTGSWFIDYQIDGRLRFCKSDGTSVIETPTGRITNNDTRHWMITKNGPVARIMKDGVVIAEATSTPVLAPSTGGYRIGATEGLTSFYLGFLQEFAIYDEALKSTDALTRYKVMNNIAT